jgi:hypothetical protein
MRPTKPSRPAAVMFARRVQGPDHREQLPGGVGREAAGVGLDRHVRPVGYEAGVCGESSGWIDCRQSVASCQREDQPASGDGERTAGDDESGICKTLYGVLDIAGVAHGHTRQEVHRPRLHAIGQTTCLCWQRLYWRHDVETPESGQRLARVKATSDVNEGPRARLI